MAKERKRRTPRREKGEAEQPPASATVAWGAIALALVAIALGGAALVLHFADEDGEAEPAVGQPTPTVQPTTPTPPAVVAAEADDDPFIGPADAPVTIISFTDYQ
ncbi:MAG: hypothetical protein JSU97_00055 [Dehalococcoidia bacterium]|nr:MAG: hypothetical protein JSU97_00055 [Dehalococcoidia bacterium]